MLGVHLEGEGGGGSYQSWSRHCRFDCLVCDCNCWCVFMEHSRQKIATGAVREKKWLEKAKKSGRTSGGDASLKECNMMA